ncbi:head-tail adaptor protein [Thioclava sp. BHET1]|nr:head-tail adaptor protein [Thioclava sp. BHET1]
MVRCGRCAGSGGGAADDLRGRDADPQISLQAPARISRIRAPGRRLGLLRRGRRASPRCGSRLADLGAVTMRFDRKAAFSSPATVPDGFGGQTVGWHAEFTAWAALTYRTGGETVLAGRLQAKQLAVMRLRRSAKAEAIRASWKAVIGGVTWNIRETPTPTGDRRFLEMLVESGVGG